MLTFIVCIIQCNIMNHILANGKFEHGNPVWISKWLCQSSSEIYSRLSFSLDDIRFSALALFFASPPAMSFWILFQAPAVPNSCSNLCPPRWKETRHKIVNLHKCTKKLPRRLLYGRFYDRRHYRHTNNPPFASYLSTFVRILIPTRLIN